MKTYPHEAMPLFKLSIDDDDLLCGGSAACHAAARHFGLCGDFIVLHRACEAAPERLTQGVTVTAMAWDARAYPPLLSRDGDRLAGGCNLPTLGQLRKMARVRRVAAQRIAPESEQPR